MRIIKQGNAQETDKKKFKCNNCSCEFECGINEYYTDTDSALSYPSKKVYIASCPCCHRICIVEQQVTDWTTTYVKTDDWINNNYTITCGSTTPINTIRYSNITPTGSITTNCATTAFSTATGDSAKNDTRRNKK